MFKTMLLPVALFALVACSGQVKPFQTEGQASQASYTKKTWYQGAWAMWETDMPCEQPVCMVTNGSVILAEVQTNGRFRCEANVDQGKTLEMTFSCP